MVRKIMVLCFAAVLLGQAGVNENTPGWFPFPMSALDSFAGTPLDVSFLNKSGATSRIRVEGSRFVNADGKRQRFIGTNVTFSGAFPEKEMATKIANRMGQLGFNVVRFHHMDARDIWLPGKLELDPAKLDLLDWFIAELKRNGIYSNINLHVSRTYPGLAKLTKDRSFRYGKIVDKFYDPYLSLQEKYAKDLLTHVNSYTKMKLAEDPAVAFVELNNENTLLSLSLGKVEKLPAPHRESLQRKWREWLQKNYASLEELEKTWTEKLIPLGEEVLKNNDFSQGSESWSMEGGKLGVCEMSASKGSNGSPALRIKMSEVGKVSWAYQLHQLEQKFKDGMVYSIKFKGRANPARKVNVALRFAEPPWTVLSRPLNVELTPEWREFTFSSAVSGVKDDLKQRFSFNFGDAVGVVELQEVSLRPGNIPFNFDPEIKTLSDVPLPTDIWPSLATADFRKFLIETECAYVKRLKTYLVEKLSVKALIIDTQASYGSLWGLHREATLSDYTDMHAYWQHPRFPGKPWDGNNWNIANTSMVAAELNRSTFERLSSYRLEGRPFSVSEYNHSAPSDYAAEIFPFFVAYASHQDWDALYQFCYGNRASNYENPKISGYFSLSSHSGQLAFAPIATLIFRQNLLPAARGYTTVKIPESYLRNKLEKKYPSLDDLAREGVFSNEQKTTGRFSVAFTAKGDKPEVVTKPGTDEETFVWEREGESPYLSTSAPAARIVIGEIGGRKFQLGDMEITVQPSSGKWAAFGLATADAKPLAVTKHALFALGTHVENSDMIWNEDRTSVGRNWGTSPVVAQGLSAEMTLPGTIKPKIIALDSRGKIIAEVPVGGRPGAWTVSLGAEYKTLWYALKR